MPNTVGEKTTTGTDRCHRCGGLMVPEQVFEIRSIDFRCVSCGERIDPVILAHRQTQVRMSSQAKKLKDSLLVRGKPASIKQAPGPGIPQPFIG